MVMTVNISDVAPNCCSGLNGSEYPAKIPTKKVLKDFFLNKDVERLPLELGSHSKRFKKKYTAFSNKNCNFF
jgi:hypothetical protein